MRHHLGVLLCVTSWLLMGLAGCAGDSMKSSSETPSISPIARAEQGKEQPPSGEVQERALPRQMLPGPGTAPPPVHPQGSTAPPPLRQPMPAVMAPPAPGTLSVLPGEFVISPYRRSDYVTAIDGGGRTTNTVATDRTTAGAWEKFKLWFDPNTRYHPPPTYRYAVQTLSGYYLTAVNGGGLSGPAVLPGGQTTDVIHTDATQPRAWEMFGLLNEGSGGSINNYNLLGITVVDMPGMYALQTASGNYVTALGGGGHPDNAVHTDATKVGAWELFFLRKCGDLGSGYQYMIRVTQGLPMFALGGGGQIKNALGLGGTGPGDAGVDPSWYRFRLIRQDDGSYALQTVSRNYVTAVGGGGLVSGTPDTLHTDATQVQAWEKFRLVDQGNCVYTIQTVSGYYLGDWPPFATDYNINAATKFYLTMYFIE